MKGAKWRRKGQMTDVPHRILDLIETFDCNIEAYRSPQYNETQLRREFIDPFFEELGWDVTNKSGCAPQYRDVIHEDAISVSGATKAPDYCFRIGGVRKFFLEAKKPSINIKGDPHPAYQLRRYAWSAKLPLSILTDFEEFAVYDCQMRPKHTDSAATARIMFLNYKQYPEKWHEIADIFGKDAILKGSFDKFAVSEKGKRGTTTVDTEFLAEIEGWRNMLARIIALRNRSLSMRELNFAVQQTIDRILFLRMCEDRGIEPYGQLQSITPGDRTYPRLCEIFEKADQKYNSGLFHFEDEPNRPEPPDKLTLNLAIDDVPLKWILGSLYYPQSPYEFSVLPAEILGNVYEQFLGKVIRLTPARQAKIDEKPEVKKAGGVYYTPSYIVDYIVKNTVGKLLGALPNTLSEVEGSDYVCHCEEAEGRRSNLKSLTPKQIANLKILDPACGSGSFLLGAYTYLLNYHRDWYVANDPQKHTKQIYQGRAGDWFLTITEKKRILLNNIFGVDIDLQAVEVTKLSLLLKVLEGENSQTLENQYRLFHERALPDLANNIKCGNSLIGPDFYENIDPASVTDDLRQKINTFDWQQEFPHIFSRRNPGFDAVLGNPPWIFTKYVDWGEPTKAYITANYLQRQESEARGKARQSGKINLFAIFTLQGINLLRNGGLFSFILPNNILRTTIYDTTRKRILQTTRIKTVVDLKAGVFPRVTAATVIMVLEKGGPGVDTTTKIIDSRTKGEISEQNTHEIKQATFLKNTSYVFNIFARDEDLRICQKMRSQGVTLSTLAWEIIEGIVTNKGKEKYITTEPKGSEYKRFLEGKDIGPYNISWPGRYILFDKEVLHRTRPDHIWQANKKVLVQRIGGGSRPLVATLDCEHYYTFASINNIVLNEDVECKIEYLLGLLNSRLLNYYYVMNFTNASELTVNISKTFLEQLPIRTIDFDNPDDVAKHDKMVKLVERMLDLHKNLAAARIPDEKTRIQRQISATDSQIDKLVYKLYNLTEEEIKIIEESTK
jgi:hypothetical protein